MKFRDIHCVRKPVYRGTHGSARTLKRRLGVRFSAASVSRFCLVAGCQFDTPAFFGVNLVHRDSRCEAQTHAIPCVGLVVQSVSVQKTRRPPGNGRADAWVLWDGVTLIPDFMDSMGV